MKIICRKCNSGIPESIIGIIREVCEACMIKELNDGTSPLLKILPKSESAIRITEQKCPDTGLDILVTEYSDGRTHVEVVPSLVVAAQNGELFLMRFPDAPEGVMQ